MSNNGRTITRSRPSFTCVPCKRKKVKCDKRKPGCQHCAKADIVCFYDSITTGAGNSSQQQQQEQQQEQQTVEDAFQQPPSAAQPGLKSPSPSSKRRHLSQVQQEPEPGQGQEREQDSSTMADYPIPAENGDMQMRMQHHHHQHNHHHSTSSSRTLGSVEVGFGSESDNLRPEPESPYYHMTPESFDHADYVLDQATWENLDQISTSSLYAFAHPHPPPPPPPPSEPARLDAHTHASSSSLPILAPIADDVLNVGWDAFSVGLGWPMNPESGPRPHDNGISNQASHANSPSPPSALAVPQPRIQAEWSSSESVGSTAASGPPRPPISRTFWAVFGGGSAGSHKGMAGGSGVGGGGGGGGRSIGEKLRQAHQKTYLDRRLSAAHLTQLDQIARKLPPRSLCDVLLQVFVTVVHPLLPLVDVETLHSRYDDFWSHGIRERTLLRDQGDPFDRISFLGLLWAALYCGAVAAPSVAQDKTSLLRDPIPDSLLARLKSNMERTLSLSCYQEVATLDGLMASVLVYECDPNMDGLVGGPSSLSRLVQAAKTLQLDSEVSWTGATGASCKSHVERETGQRVWKHVVSLQIMNSFMSGEPLPSHLGAMDSDADGSATANGNYHGLDSNNNNNNKTSTGAILAAGRYEASRILRQVVETCSDNNSNNNSMPNGMATETRKTLVLQSVGKFHLYMDDLISRLSARGLPEQGQIPSKLFETGSLGDLRLYGDSPQQQTVFNSFARILLSMMKHHISIISGRMLGLPWNILLPSCIRFLQNYIHASQLPAFYPYRWFLPAKWQPLHECYVVLEYLKQSGPGGGSDAQLVRYLLNEVLDMFRPREDTRPENVDAAVQPWQRAAWDLYAAPWAILRQMNDDIEGREAHEDDSGYATRTSTTPSIHSPTPPPQPPPPPPSHPPPRQSNGPGFGQSHSNNDHSRSTPPRRNKARAATTSSQGSSIANTKASWVLSSSSETQGSIRGRGESAKARATSYQARPKYTRHNSASSGGITKATGPRPPPPKIAPPPSRRNSPRPFAHMADVDDEDNDDDEDSDYDMGGGCGCGDESQGDESQDEEDHEEEMQDVWSDVIVLDRGQQS